MVKAYGWGKGGGGGEREGGEGGGKGGKVVWVKLSPRTFSPVLL